jgi:hypothetical protein
MTTAATWGPLSRPMPGPGQPAGPSVTCGLLRTLTGIPGQLLRAAFALRPTFRPASLLASTVPPPFDRFACSRHRYGGSPRGPVSAVHCPALPHPLKPDGASRNPPLPPQRVGEVIRRQAAGSYFLLRWRAEPLIRAARRGDERSPLAVGLFQSATRFGSSSRARRPLGCLLRPMAALRVLGPCPKMHTRELGSSDPRFLGCPD